MTTAAEIAAFLLTYGYAVFPFPLGEELGPSAFDAAVAGFPEYLPGAPGPRDLGWGAFNCPSSFHCPYARKMRRKFSKVMRKIVRAVNAIKGTTYKLQILMDRMYKNDDGKVIGKEGFHRDIYKKSAALGATQCITGGFVAVSGDQHMYLCPGTHNDMTLREASEADKRGFAKVPKEQWPKYEKLVEKILVPVGHCIVFFQHIVHKVAGGKMPMRYRVFVGASWSEEGKDLFPGLKQDIEDQAVPHIPSGQPKTNMYSSNHFSFFRDRSFKAAPGITYPSASNWAEKNFEPAYLEDRTTKNGDSYKKPLSGKAIRLRKDHRYSPYKRKDRKIMKPRTC